MTRFLKLSLAVAMVALLAPAALHAQKPGINGLLASADVEAGRKLAENSCSTCHSMAKGGHRSLGPDLWNVVGSPIASKKGFEYSDALTALNGKKWTYEELDGFITDPRQYVSGTRMTFAGFKNPQDRADLIAWLRLQADNPAPLPGK